LNNSGAANNYIVLQQSGLKGLRLASSEDAESRSRFFQYAALGYYYQIKFDSAQYYFYEGLHEAQKGHVTRQITRACVALIPVNFQLQQHEKVEECKNILQSIVDTCRDPALLKDGYYALGSYYQQKSYYSTAQDYFIKSIEIREKDVDKTKEIKPKFDYAIQCDMLSKLYLNTQMVDKSLHALRQGGRFANVSPVVSNRLLSSFVEAFTMSGNIDSALFYNNELENQTKDNSQFPSEIVSSDLNIAIYYMDHHLYGQALPYIDKGNTLAANIQSPLLIFQAQMIKGRYKEETGKYDEAISLLTPAIPVAAQLNKELHSNILRYMGLAQKGKGNTAIALQYFEQYSQEADSLSKEKLSINFADQETRYETTQKEQQIASLDKENRLNTLELQTASRTRIFLILGLIASGVIALLLYFIYRNKEKVNILLNKQNDQLETLNGELAVANETKAKLFGIIGHDLRSPISRIVQLLQLQKANPGALTEESRMLHEEKLKTTSENVLETMEDLLLWSKSQMQQFTPQYTPVKIAEIVQKELNLLQQPIKDKDLRIENEVPDFFLKTTDENIVSVIIRNLLQNAVKYSKESTTISILASGQNLYINNQSSEANAEALNELLHNKRVDSKSSGLGLQMSNDLAASIHAKIAFAKQYNDRLTAIVSWEK
jgi:signal transduction histidine kinase